VQGRLAAADRVIVLALRQGDTISQTYDEMSIYYTRNNEFPCRFPAKPSIITAGPSQIFDPAWFLPRGVVPKKILP
jgi:hypothetical protein